MLRRGADVNVKDDDDDDGATPFSTCSTWMLQLCRQTEFAKASIEKKKSLSDNQNNTPNISNNNFFCSNDFYYSKFSYIFSLLNITCIMLINGMIK